MGLHYELKKFVSITYIYSLMGEMNTVVYL